MKKIYGTFRYHYTQYGVRYSPSYKLNPMFEDYKQAGLTAIKDNVIPENRYTKELAPGIKKMTRFIIGEYNEDYINGEDFKKNVASVGAEFNIDMFNTPEEAIQWIKDNTDLKEVEPGKFEISPASKDEITGEDRPAKYLIIE